MTDLQKALTALRNPSHLIMESRESVIVYKDDLDAVLDRLEELEAKRFGAVDQTTELEVGDAVVALISYMELEPGTEGVVIGIEPGSGYEIIVKFEGRNFKYLDGDTLKFHRSELGLVDNG